MPGPRLRPRRCAPVPAPSWQSPSRAPRCARRSKAPGSRSQSALALPAHPKQIALLLPGGVQLALEGVLERTPDRVGQVDVRGRDPQELPLLTHVHQALQRVLRLLAGLDVADASQDLVAVRARE